MTRNSHDWIQTFTGRQFWPLDPRVEDVCIEDIAHALSNTCRFCGHTREFYSVAQHSILESCYVEAIGGPRVDALWGLLHDASEAYLHDITRPLKRSDLFGEAYVKAEARLMRVIADAFGLPGEMPGNVKFADEVALVTEMRDLMDHVPAGQYAEPLREDIVPWTPRSAELAFLDRFHALTEVQRG